MLVCGGLWGAVAGDTAAGETAGAGLVVLSGDASGDGTGAVVCCPFAVKATSKEAVIIHFQVRMTKSSLCGSVRQLENHMYGRRGIYGLIVVLGRLKTHLICRFDRRFVQAMTHATHHAIHVQLTIGPKHYFQ
jgi:hypothetical protein